MDNTLKYLPNMYLRIFGQHEEPITATTFVDTLGKMLNEFELDEIFITKLPTKQELLQSVKAIKGIGWIQKQSIDGISYYSLTDKGKKRLEEILYFELLLDAPVPEGCIEDF